MHPRPLTLLEGLMGVFQQARMASQKEVRENVREVEEAVRKNQDNQLSDADLLAEIDARRVRMRELLKKHHVKHGGRMDRLTLGLLEALREKVVAKMSVGASMVVLVLVLHDMAWLI